MKKLVLLGSVLAAFGLRIIQVQAETSSLTINATAGNADTTFTISSGILSFPTIDPSYTGGSITFTVTDNDGNGALLTEPSGTALFNCLINGSTFHQLGAGPYNVNVPINGSVTLTLDFGTPIPSLPGPSASDIQSIVKFTLSPHDGFSSSSFFTVDSLSATVPDGGSSAALLGLALGAVMIWRATVGKAR
jgi:hypothetical protein